MLKSWKKVFISVFIIYCLYLIYTIYWACSGGIPDNNCFSKSIGPGVWVITYIVIVTALWLWIDKSINKNKESKKEIKKWYIFFIWLLAISLFELFSAYFLQISRGQRMGSGEGVISLGISIPLVYIFGVGIAGSIARFVHGFLNMWFIWGLIVWYLRMKLKTTKG